MRRRCLLLTLFACAVVSCNHEQQPAPQPSSVPSSAPSPTPTPSPSLTPSPKPSASPSPVGANCSEVEEIIRLKAGALAFPREGKFVEESHYATDQETFNGKLFPSTTTDQIARHLKLSCALLKTYGFALTASCSEVYKHSWEKEWTPAEGGGVAGQAARSNLKSSLTEELWQGNLMYRPSSELPDPGTRYIATNPANGKKVVVQFGFEIGPSDTSWLGGFTTEVHWYLGSSNDSVVHLGRAADQMLPLGPVRCR